MKVIFYPAFSKSNDYINLFVDAIEKKGCQVANKNWNSDFALIFKSLIEAIKTKKVIFHFNWLEDNASASGIAAKIKCGLILTFFRFFHLFGGRIVWTMHNAKSHNANSNKQEAFIRKMLKYIDKIVVHCSESREILNNKYNVNDRKIVFVPIGNYCSVMDKFIEEHASDNTPKISFLYFGAISKYKGVEKLIQAFNNNELSENAVLTVCGKPNTDDLKNSIEKMAAPNNSIKLMLRFVSNEELGHLISASDVVVLPYEKESMQNSSAAIMAFTCGKPAIIPVFGYIKDILDKEFVITYDYKNEEEKITELRNTMIDIMNKSRDNKIDLKQMGINARSFAQSELDWNEIASSVVSAYKKL